MNRTAVADLIAVGDGFTTEFVRSGHAGLGREMRARANGAGGTNLLGATNDGEVVEMAEAAGSSRYG